MSAQNRRRLDVLLVEKGYFPTREQAKRAIMAGLVRVDDQPCTKPGAEVAAAARLTVTGKEHPYVSRGGLKLAKALDEFQISVAGRVALDVGASTGGFTDCLLKRGAVHVYAVDVGYGQLDWSLRQDERVTVLERTNARYLQPGQIPVVEMITIDVSFISLSKIIPAVRIFLAEEGDLVALVKPQFEAGPNETKRGVVRDKHIHVQVLQDIWKKISSLELSLRGATYSPITGPKGNIEFFVHFTPRPVGTAAAAQDWPVLFAEIVEKAHEELT
ncbi:MAG TPA: TlyA family RNA methyltransferase [Firmicutes bacterium]|nr:TlyA family RNA methyltransferase [Bacillota bacterium]